MDTARMAVWATVILIVSITLISGPLVKGVDFTRNTTATPDFAPGTGSIEITVDSLPANARFDKGEFGAGAYYLRVPAAQVTVSDINQQPMLVYKIRIPEMGFSRGTTHFMEREMTGQRRLELKEATVAPDKITKDTYHGELLILVRADGGERVMARQNITVNVTS